jgi:hypothetical protein
MRINDLKAQYEIPGFEIAPRAFEPEEAGDDFSDAPYSQDAAVLSVPSTAGWQELLGLTAIAPSPISIDPPTREKTSGWRSGAAASYHLPREAGGVGTEMSVTSPSVRQMMAVLAQTRRAVARIRARAKEVA